MTRTSVKDCECENSARRRWLVILRLPRPLERGVVLRPFSLTPSLSHKFNLYHGQTLPWKVTILSDAEMRDVLGLLLSLATLLIIYRNCLIKVFSLLSLLFIRRPFSSSSSCIILEFPLIDRRSHCSPKHFCLLHRNPCFRLLLLSSQIEF
jgi:hypothetical protein